VAGQILSGGEAGLGYHVAQDSAAEIMPSGGQEASRGFPIF